MIGNGLGKVALQKLSELETQRVVWYRYWCRYEALSGAIEGVSRSRRV